MCTIGSRLKEERLRLGYSQKDIGTVGGVGKTTQINYEKDKNSPDSVYLSKVHKIGLDVNYVVTGARSLDYEMALDEQELLIYYRHMSDDEKRSVKTICHALCANRASTPHFDIKNKYGSYNDQLSSEQLKQRYTSKENMPSPISVNAVSVAMERLEQYVAMTQEHPSFSERVSFIVWAIEMYEKTGESPTVVEFRAQHS